MNDINNEVLITTKKGHHSNIGVITLNRPKALNALSYNMIQNITKALLEWRDDDTIAAVVIQGAEDRAFCAGGDIKSLYTHGKNEPELCMQFFYHEYRLNKLIKSYPKPYIALLHGITMGGGIGVGLHGSHKVAAQNLTLAMPESGIGFFTDIGASYFLSRCQDRTGLYLALTGNKINCIDAKHLGLVDRILKTEDFKEGFDNIIIDLANSELSIISNKDKQRDLVNNILAKHSDNTTLHELNDKLTLKTKTDILNHTSFINSAFNASNLEEMYSKLISNQTSLNKEYLEWAKTINKTLQTKSPSSLLVIFEQLKRGSELSFDDCMKMEYGIAYGFITKNDFYEGVRALLIDKDNSPRWEKIDINAKTFNYNHYFNNSYSNKLEFI